uniref:Ribosomal protein S11 n=1 Tax=Pterospora andromedea TaxID=4349 RepID=A0A221SRC6_PTEAN|nr:ribosomal protein S11 [Pterospora andromedea]
MAKTIHRISLHRNRRIRVRKNKRKISKGVIHVQASLTNTIVTITDIKGRAVFWSSTGIFGFRGRRRGTPFAAQTAVGNAISTVADQGQGMKRARVMIKGAGRGRDAALRTIGKSGLKITYVRDVTPMAHNGCRPPKKRRV